MVAAVDVMRTQLSSQASGKLPEVYNTVNFKWYPKAKSQKNRKTKTKNLTL